MTNPTVPTEYKAETMNAVRIGRHSISGTSTIVFPGVEIAEGCATSAAAVVINLTEPWSVYVGYPARGIKRRKQDLLELEKAYLASVTG
jgi:acetyltransferase-like isoleucine patch superfamily enzyme